MTHPTTLALDTSTRAGSLALLRRGRVEAVLIGDASRTHGERLPGDIAALLARASARLPDIELYAVVNGPGSFTGLRVGIAAVQGLALAQGRRVVPVSALDAFASAEDFGEGPIAVWMDAQRKQIFAALYGRSGARVDRLAVAVSMAPDDVVRAWQRAALPPPQAVIGDGVTVYGDVARRAWPEARLVLPVPPLAPIAAVTAAAHPEAAVPPHAIVPIYVRASDAELARERAKQGAR